MKYVLWIVQILLALLFLFAGVTKLILPIETLMAQGSPNQIIFPGGFLRFIGVCEVLGGLGLIFPALTGIKPKLTVLAAGLLAVIMIGAIVAGVVADGLVGGLVPFVVLLLLVFVAYGRSRLVTKQT